MNTKRLALLSISVLAMLVLVSSALDAPVSHTETFDLSGLTGTYADGSFVGNGNITWNYVQARDEGSYPINGAGMMFRDINGRIYSNTIPGGIGDFSVKLKKGSATSGDRQVELFINSVSKGQSNVFDDDNVHTFTVNGINLTGNVVIEIKNIQDVHIVIDDLYWTEYTEPTPEEPQEVKACKLIGNPNNNLRISKIDFNNEGFSGTKFGDDDVWFPLDEIEVKIEIENKGNDKIKDIEIEWGLYNPETGEWIIELDDEKDFDLKEDKEETLTITFKLDERDMDIDLDELTEDNYRFYVIANGYDTEYEEDVCASDYEESEMIIETDFVVVDNIQLQEKVPCGADVQVTADVWNIGDEDQEDVFVRVYNEELGISEMIEIGEVDAFDKEELNIMISTPNDAVEKTYALNFDVYDDDEIYENDYDEDKSKFDKLFVIEGSCGVQKDVLVSATLESGGAAGEELVVRATITNLGDTLSTYTLTAEGHTGWASLLGIEPSTLALGAGESKDVLFTFNVKDDVSGDQTFDIEVMSENELVATQPVSVTIQGKETLSGITGNIINEGNWYLWGIAILNVVLIIIIIAVAVRVARR